MLKPRIFSIYVVLWCYGTFITYVNPLSVNKMNEPALNITAKTLNSDTSHEAVHSKNDGLSRNNGKHMAALGKSSSKGPFVDNVNPVHKTVKKILINTNKTHAPSITESPVPFNPGKVMVMEGGTVPLLSASKSNTTNNDNTTPRLKIFTGTSEMVSEHPLLSESIRPTHPPHKVINNTETPKIMHPQYGPHKEPGTSSVTPHVRKKKPLFTIVPSDKESRESDSFIESSTTGRDYVLPIVLFILALPLVGYVIKLIYKRGTEFTERQQYHRMYLIDGMYNTR